VANGFGVMVGLAYYEAFTTEADRRFFGATPPAV
jgi:hypothetical protein